MLSSAFHHAPSSVRRFLLVNTFPSKDEQKKRGKLQWRNVLSTRTRQVNTILRYATAQLRAWKAGTGIGAALHYVYEFRQANPNLIELTNCHASWMDITKVVNEQVLDLPFEEGEYCYSKGNMIYSTIFGPKFLLIFQFNSISWPIAVLFIYV